ncbi:hypothetical protein V6Z11_D05G124800 [Gossypium hirsutum]
MTLLIQLVMLRLTCVLLCHYLKITKDMSLPQSSNPIQLCALAANSIERVHIIPEKN